MKLGAHLSIEGGISQTPLRACQIGANTVQLFSSPPRNWQPPNIPKKEIKKFLFLSKKYHLNPIFIHAKYLINLNSQNQEIIKKSQKSLIDDLKIAHKIKAVGVVFHPHLKNLSLMKQSLCFILKTTPPKTFIILENSSQEGLISSSLIIKSIKNQRIKFCLDIAHAFQFGYDLTKNSQCQKIINDIKNKIGFSRWLLIHANDSATNCGSKNDRHQNIGQGKLGLKPFKFFLKHPISSRLPFIIETPGFKKEGLSGDKKNLRVLKKLIY